MMQKTIGKEDFFTKNVLKLGNDMIYKIDVEHKRLNDFLENKVYRATVRTSSAKCLPFIPLYGSFL